MLSVTELIAQLQGIWTRFTSKQQVSIVFAIALSVVTIAGVGYWAMQPRYVVLADHLVPGQTAEYVSALETAGISYQLNFAGSSISVPQSQHSQARIQVGDLIDTATSTESEMSGSLWADPAMNQVRLLRQQETRLARTIEQIQSVRTATVHITRAESSPFVRNQQATKASVTLDLKSGVPFSASDTATVTSLVAHSIENLPPENVTVLSTDGRLLSSQNGVNGEVAGQLEYRTMLEANLASKAENLLIPLLGVGNVTVRVSAQIDFTETERTQKTIDPDSKAKVKEELHTETFSGNEPLPFGPPGTASNVATPTDPSPNSGKRESEDITTEYVNGETIDLIRELPGKIQRLTVAAVVQLPEAITPPTDAAQPTAAGGATGDQAAAAATVVSKKEIEAIIRNAVGFDELRGDEIEVVAATFAKSPEIVLPVGWFHNIEKILPLLKALSLGLAAIVALILGTMIIRKLSPVVVETTTHDSLSPEIVDRLNELSDQMKENPEVVTTVLASWLSSSEAEEQPNQKRRAA